MNDVIRKSLLLVMFGIIYGFLGAFAGYFMHRVAYGFDEDWKNSSLTYQIADVTLEIGVFVMLTFWLSSGTFRYVAQSLGLSPRTRTLLDFILGTMFLETLFVFAGDFESKMQHVSYRIFGRDPDEL